MGRRRKRQLRGIGTAGALLAASLSATFILAASLILGESAAGASPAQAAVEYYLDLGGSASVGFQPTVKLSGRNNRPVWLHTAIP